MTRKHLSALLAIAISGGIFVLDRWTKMLVLAHPPVATSSWLTMTLHRNAGLLANAPLPLWAIYLLTAIAIIGVVMICVRAWKQDRQLTLIGASLILAGAFGNVFDRIHSGAVIDWIFVFHWSIFNIADISIALGILCILINDRHTS